MGKLEITVMGFRCDRCGHEWVPRDSESEPRVCPKCKSPYWNKPRKIASATSYEDFRDKIVATLKTFWSAVDMDRYTHAQRAPAEVSQQRVGASNGKRGRTA